VNELLNVKCRQKNVDDIDTRMVSRGSSGAVDERSSGHMPVGWSPAAILCPSPPLDLSGQRTAATTTTDATTTTATTATTANFDRNENSGSSDTEAEDALF